MSSSLPESPPLEGLRVIELAGLAPSPFAGILLADYGASVLRVDRPGISQTPTIDPLTRHKSSVQIDLRDPPSRQVFFALLKSADILIDPFRPGVLEGLGLCPSNVLLKNYPRLVIARMTGFRRDGKYQRMAGHDINFLAVSGVLSMLGRAGDLPYPPGNILGDFAGGGAMGFLGIMLALAARSRTGRGQVVEANMVDGSAYLATGPRLLRKGPIWDAPRGKNLLDGGCPYYSVYETMDRGKYFAIGANEPQFYETLVQGLGLSVAELPDREVKANWPVLRSIFREKFYGKTRKEWEAVFDGTDACATPVLEQDELERDRYEQRLPINLVDTPGIPIQTNDGGWSGGGLVPGHGTQDILVSWMGWEYEKDFSIREHDGALTPAYGSRKSRF